MLSAVSEIDLLQQSLTRATEHSTLAETAETCLAPFNHDDRFRVLCAVLLQLEVITKPNICVCTACCHALPAQQVLGVKHAYEAALTSNPRDTAGRRNCQPCSPLRGAIPAGGRARRGAASHQPIPAVPARGASHLALSIEQRCRSLPCQIHLPSDRIGRPRTGSEPNAFQQFPSNRVCWLWQWSKTRRIRKCMNTR